MDRVSTGVPGLDAMLGGGLIPARPYVISGPPGSGKTILAMHFLAAGLAQGEPCLMVTLDEPPNEVKANVGAFRWNLDKLKILDATPDIKAHKRTRSVIDVGTTLDLRDLESVGEIRQSSQVRALEVSVHSVQKMLKQEFFARLERTKERYTRVVVDSLTALKMFSMQGEDSRIMIQSFLRFLSEIEATCVLVSERLNPKILETEFFLCRGEIRLHKWLEGNTIRRAISIEKFRGSAFNDLIRPLAITDKGLSVDTKGTISFSGVHTRQMGQAYLEQRIIDEVSTIIDGVLKGIEDAHRLKIPVTDVDRMLARAMLQLHRRNYEKALKAALNTQVTIQERLKAAPLPPPPPATILPPPGGKK